MARQWKFSGARRLVTVGLVLAVAALPATAGASQLSEDRFEGDFASDKVLVKFKETTGDGQVRSVAQSNDLQLEETLELADTSVFRITDGSSAERVITDLRRDPRVASAEPDYILKSTAISNDTHAARLWGLDNTGQSVNGRVGRPDIDVSAPQAWDTSQGDDVVVAVIDEGVDISHPEFAGRIWQNSDCNNDGVDTDNNGYIDDCNGWDFFNRDNSVYDPADGDDHGTHVAGTVAANVNNAIGVAGVAPKAKIMPLKFLGPGGGATSDAVRAIAYAKAKGVRIVNCSWGGPNFSSTLRDAIANSGMMFAVAAGNEATSLTSAPKYPAAYDLPNMITVASVDNDGALSSFSNFGGTTDVGAPGSLIYSTMPRPPAASVMVDNSPSFATWRTSTWGFGLEDVVGRVTRSEIVSKQLTRMGAVGSSPILVVDDDESNAASVPDTNSYYLTALADAGYTNVTTHEVVKNASGPTAAQMAGRFVIWQTGYALGAVSVNTLTPTDLTNIDSFLNGGGKFILAGADALYRSETSAFVTGKLGISQVSEGDTRTAASGVAGSALENMSISLAGAESPRGTQNTYKDRFTVGAASARNSVVLDAASDWSSSYGFKSGTSMASPHVAGIAALVAHALPSASAVQIANIVMSSTKPLTSLSSTTTTGGLVDAQRALQLATSGAPPATPPAAKAPGTTNSRNGYRFVASDGGIFSYGGAGFYGSAGGTPLNQPVVGMAARPSGDGYWLVARDGGIFSFNAPFLGSAGGIKLNQSIVGMAATPSGNGYWLVASDGGIFSYGDASFFGSAGGIKLNQPIVGMAATPTGRGYWLVANDGGIFSYGDASFFGSTGGMKLNQPIVGMSPTPSGNGYWLVASDGGIFNYGDSSFRGSAGSLKLNRPIVGIASTPTGLGYWLVSSDGGVFSYGDAVFFGSAGSLSLNKPIVAMSG